MVSEKRCNLLVNINNLSVVWLYRCTSLHIYI